jgi:hypothetical protein
MGVTHTTEPLKTQSKHKDKAKKVGMTFMKKSKLNQYTNGMRSRVFIPNCTNNNKSSFKPRTHNNQNTSKAYHDKPKASNDRDKIATIPTREDMICFNCEEPGHYTRDCKKPKQIKLHMQAAHTAIIDEEDNDDHDQDDQTSEHNA